jgi:hypothetical protein
MTVATSPRQRTFTSQHQNRRAQDDAMIGASLDALSGARQTVDDSGT